MALRGRLGWGPDRLAALVGVPAATVHRVLGRHSIVGPKPAPVPVVCSEHAAPGSLVHPDTEKLGRIVGARGHRATGARRRRQRSVGREVLRVAIDDATRLVDAEILADEKGRTTASFLVRALRWCRARGIAVERILSDNGSPFVSRALRAVVRRLGLKQSRTPTGPRRTPSASAGSEPSWPSARSRGLQPFCGTAACPRALCPLLQRGAPSPGIGGRTPRQRLREKQAA